MCCGTEMKFSDYVLLNPSTKLNRGVEAPFVAMEMITPGIKKVFPGETRLPVGSGSKFAPGDTLFARITPCLENGKIAQFAGETPGMGSTELFVLRAIEGVSDADYVYYFSQGRPLRLAAQRSMSGATGRQRASLASLSDFECTFPPLEEQKKIAQALSNYDNLIENNNRRIKILDELVKTIYKEWFSNLRFPGHKESTFFESSIGPIPDGWRVVPIGEIVSYLSRGISPKYCDDGYWTVVNQKCIRNQHLNLKPSRRQEKPVPEAKIIKFGDILINSTGVGTLGRVAQVYQDIERLTADSHLTIVRPSSEINIDYFGSALLSLESKFESLGVGATGQTELSRNAVSDIQIIIPTTIIQDKFSQLVGPMKLAAINYAKINSNLEVSRDLLASKLINFN